MAIQKLIMKNVTVFDEISMDFSKGVNVLIGSNGMGKTHIMKLLYSACQAVRHDVSFPEKVMRTFRPDKSEISRLVRRDGTSGKHTASVLVESNDAKIGMTFASDTKKWNADDVSEDKWEEKHSDLKSVFIPAKEMLTHSYNLINAVRSQNVEFDDSYIDHLAYATVMNISLDISEELFFNFRDFVNKYELILQKLQRIPKETQEDPKFEEIFEEASDVLSEERELYEILKGIEISQPLSQPLKEILSRIETVIGGTVELDETQHFYLANDSGRLEFNLVAEGLRKIALLWQLIQNGALEKGSILFWDEPEANLNPEHIPMIADLLLLLQREGVQVFVSTHDYFLARYLDVRAKDDDEIAFFSLYKEKNDDAVRYEMERSFHDLEHNPIKDTFNRLYHEEIEQWME